MQQKIEQQQQVLSEAYNAVPPPSFLYADSRRQQQQQQPHQALSKAYNAVAPPAFLYADSRRVNPNLAPNLISKNRVNYSPNLNPSPNPKPGPSPSHSPSPSLSDGDSEKKTRRRRTRRLHEVSTEAIDVASSSGSNGVKESSSLRRKEFLSSSEMQECTSFFRSPSPNCMPGPSCNSKCCETTNAPTVHTACEPAASSSTPNRAKCRDIPIAKPKWKDVNKPPSMSNGDSRLDKVKYSPKIKTDMACSSKSAQDCSCPGILGSHFLSDETSTSNCYGHYGDEHGIGSSRQELKFRGSPPSEAWTSKGRYSQNQKLYKAPAQRSCFQPHWSPAKVEKALEEGEAFRCKIRVNAHCRTEAYVSIDGVSIDVLIDGTQAQNRAIDGDIVAVVVNPVSMWTKLKGCVAKQNSTDLNKGLNDTVVCGNEISSIEVTGCSSDEEQSFCVEQELEVTSGDFSTSAVMQVAGFEVSGAPFKMMNETGVFSSNSSTQSNASNSHRSDQQHDLLQSESSDAAFPGSASKIFQELVSHVASFPDKRPTGEVVAILENSDRRQAVVGFLEVYSKAGNKCRNETSKKTAYSDSSTLNLVPSDSRFPKMVISVNTLPTNLKERYHAGDRTLDSELVAACIKDWKADCSAPCADISHTLGQGGELEAQLAAILFEHAVHSAEFPLPALKCLPDVPWKIPAEEFKRRKDMTRCRVFTIDPPTARDLDDALSVDRLENGLLRIGVHIADVSYFVHPETELDKEAQFRSTSVYLIQRVLPMLPRLLCEELCSLNPGVNRLAFSIMWDVDNSGQIVDHWIGRTVINSCCKLSYGHAQDIIDGKVLVNSNGVLENCLQDVDFPELHGEFKWGDVVDDIKALHGIAKHRRDARFEAGALRLQNSRLVFDLDEDGIPNNSSLYEHQDSNFLVEEFMLLANMTAAKVIAGAFPDCALLRRHPEPNTRKMKELEEFCNKNGLELNATSSGSLHESLQKLCESNKEDPAMCSILMLYATKPMQLAKYFSTGELKNEEDWAHYALATPFYTHFTSPIRRYPDIIVHRTLLAALEAEDVFWGLSAKEKITGDEGSGTSRCFTGLCLDKPKLESCQGQQALASAALKHKVPGSQDLSLLAEHCNRRKLASRNVRDASDKLYLWAMLKKKEGIFSEARVLAVGPKFLSLYVYKIAMERRVYFEDTEGLGVEWFNLTGTVILDLSHQKGSRRDSRQGRGRAFTDVAYLVNPALSSDAEDEASVAADRQLVNTNLSDESGLDFQKGTDADKKPEPAVLPLTLRLLASVPVYVFAIGGNSRPLDIAVRLYVSSYLQ
eukprot:c24308_g1_i2 orf=246-4160(+)